MDAYTLEQLAQITQSELLGNPKHLITGVDDLETATTSDAAFLENPRYEKQMHVSHAGVIFISPTLRRTDQHNFLINKNPSFAFQKIIELFVNAPQSGFAGIHPTAVIHQEARLGENVTIGPHAVIDRGVIIGNGSVIGSHVFIGAETIIGENCFLHPHVVIREGCKIGNRVILQPGAVIGSCGFGFFTDETGQNHKLKQLGKVEIEDDVEIGANTTIDRARLKKTIIGKGTKLDNLVQIAHQVQLGQNNLLASQVGIAGSTKTGDHVVMGGQVGVAGHISIASKTIFAARAAISKRIEESGIYSGIPAVPIKECNLHYVQLKSIGKLIQRVKDLEAKIEKILENQVSN